MTASLTTASQVNLMVATLKSLILTNKSDLGLSTISSVYEKDEDPAIALENGNVPAIYVVPLAEGGDMMNSSIGIQEIWHEFPMTIYAYYRESDIDSGLIAVRGYAYNLIDHLFGTGLTGTDANIRAAKLDVGYYVVVDYIVHYFIIKITIKALLQP